MIGFAGRVIAEPVDRFLQTNKVGVVRGSGEGYAYIDVDGWVIALTAQPVPPMPNGIAVSQGHGLQAFAPGSTVAADRVCLASTGAGVSLRSAQPWNPSLHQREGAGADIERIGRDIWQRLRLTGTDSPQRMVEMLAARGFEISADEAGRAGLLALFQSVADRDAELAGRAADVLLGRGPGLTPEGDDFLAAAAATIFACVNSCYWRPDHLATWRSAILPAPIRERTTSLSATLLELAVQGNVIRPVQVLFGADTPPAEWLGALTHLTKVGHGTGRAWAAGCAATAILATRSAN